MGFNMSQTQPQKCGRVIIHVKEPPMNNKYINIHRIPERSMGTVRFTMSTHKF